MSKIDTVKKYSKEYFQIKSKSNYDKLHKLEKEHVKVIEKWAEEKILFKFQDNVITGTLRKIEKLEKENDKLKTILGIILILGTGAITTIIFFLI